jgi:3-hydroxyacyl-[acyl-carrier-protein] dehydratase
MRWMWIDTVTAFEDGVRMEAVKNLSLSEELFHDHFDGEEDGLPPEPVMPGSLMVEGMAQTAGILVGSVNRFREKVVLAKVSKVELDEDASPGQTLRYEAEIERMDAVGASTRGVVRRLDHADGVWREIGRIDLIFSHLDNNTGGREFPEHNFVFGDNFKQILVSAGLDRLFDDAT